MKIKLSWIILALCIISIAWMVIPRVRYWFHGSAPSASEPARSFQASPEATVNTMFEMLTQQFQDTYIGLALLDDDTALQPDQQKFVQLYWDRQRAGVIYQGLYERGAELQNISAPVPTGDSVSVAVSLRAFPSTEADEKTDVVYTLELRQRGPNWYIYELRGAKSSVGVYERFQQAKSGHTTQ